MGALLVAGCSEKAAPTRAEKEAAASVPGAPLNGAADVAAKEAIASKVEEKTDLIEFAYSYPVEAARIAGLATWLDNDRAVQRAALAEPTARRVVETLLRAAAVSLTDPEHPAGCMAVQGALSCGEASEAIRTELCARRSAGEMELRKRFERAKSEGDLKSDSDPAALARYVSTLLQGMAVQASGGATRDQLGDVAEMALKSWPG